MTTVTAAADVEPTVDNNIIRRLYNNTYCSAHFASIADASVVFRPVSIDVTIKSCWVVTGNAE